MKLFPIKFFSLSLFAGVFFISGCGAHRSLPDSMVATTVSHTAVTTTVVTPPTTTPVATEKIRPVVVAATSTVPHFSHALLIVLENHSYNQVVGNNSMPYFNSLIQSYGLARNYFATTHPSIGNYFMLTTGRVVSTDDLFAGTVSGDTIVDSLADVNKTWKVYAESLPSVGYLGDSSGWYLKRHNPFAYFDSVRTDPANQARLVPFSEFASDLSAGTLPDFSLVIPNACNDAHDCSLATADAWLKKNIAPFLASPAFKDDSFLAIVFDEGKESDKQHGGGQDPAVLVGPQVRSGFQSGVFYQHQNLLKTILVGLGAKTFPAATAASVPMVDFFK